MSNDKVRRTQELRRSNAAQPIPGKRRDDIPWERDMDDDCWCDLDGRTGPCFSTVCINKEA